MSELSGTKRWLLLSFIVALYFLFSYAIFRLWPYMGEFEQYGYLGAFLVALIASISIIFPIPGIILVLAIAANPDLNWALVALAAAIGGGLGETTAYLAGYGGAVVIAPGQSKLYERAEKWMKRYGSATIFAFSLSWLPFDIVGIAAGALRFPFWKFLLATLAGRLPRTLLELYLARRGWEILSDNTWWSGLAWWSWVIIGVGMTVIIGGIIFFIVWQRRRARL
jgi:membrane protein YqaA with SNARE-associated domain